ncbi:MAG: 50S ribosomal protein L3 [Bdellovibrionaceae bacterium]|nr:50S ribosomal protein L3 [Pseudobdellovibrionaceae bacterium]MDW8190074.1 50S ribosomal protein L3 [Pseudobdellovibrionaceae bacterium]
MSTEEKNPSVSESGAGTTGARESVQLNGLFLFKEGMTTWFDHDSGQAFAVTLLRYEPQIVTQVRKYPNKGWGVQLAIGQKRRTLGNSPLLGHLKASGCQNPPKKLRELLLPESAPEPARGSLVDIESLKPGDVVKVVGTSKGRGFAGSVKRFGFAGGPASHGSMFHRQPGSGGNRTWPGRVMPGKRFPGHLGNKTVHVKNLKVVAVDKANQVVVLKGAVPGSRNSLVKVMRSAL